MRAAAPRRALGPIALLLLCAGCASHRAPAAVAPAVWPNEYLDAIRDALDPAPEEVVTNLVAIVRSNPMLVWRTFPDGDRVLMVSLVDDPSAYPSAPNAPYNSGTHDIWVTTVPEIRNLCTQPGFSRGDLARRLNQLLGLTPTFVPNAFVALWVKPSQLFRPAPDNEITDTTAGLTMPADAEAWYRKWFNQLRATQYFQSTNPPNDAYPWTQLGYTYDWGSPNHQGTSEFVIRQQSDLIVDAISPYRTYCAPSP